MNITQDKTTDGRFETFQHGCSGFYGVKNTVTGTLTIRAMSRAAARRIIRDLDRGL